MEKLVQYTSDEGNLELDLTDSISLGRLFQSDD